MKNFKKPNLCMIATIIYHLTFLGGTTTLVNGYLGEIDKLRLEIKSQSDRAIKVISNVEKAGNNIGKSVSKLDSSVKSIETELRKVKKACGRLF